ncbi:MAG TPA: hypothetical protein VI259_16530 [Gemmatimonadaceae bacterium]
MTTRSTTHRASNSVRVFADDSGRLWSAAPSGGGRVFNCSRETRHAARALAVELAKLDDAVSDDALRAWLEQAPRIGTLL